MRSITLVAMYIGARLVTVTGQNVAPLVSKKFRYPAEIPYKVDTDLNQGRGNQLGYNICNSTTEGPSSLCQTAFINSLDDFCIWAPPTPNSTVGQIEGEMVAWCTKPGHGTQIIPAGAISGVQLTRTPDYIQVVGYVDQTRINMVSGDSGGEMDPHGADGRGNPIGGIMYTNAFSGGYSQVIEWHNFIGSNKFCLKACDQNRPNAARYCEHIFDRMGCEYNAPSNARDGVFEMCSGDSQDFPGVYTDSVGHTQTYTQPPESMGPIGTIPYTARVPASSSCTQFRSTDIYGGGATVPVPFPVVPRTTNTPSYPTHTPSTSSSEAAYHQPQATAAHHDATHVAFSTPHQSNSTPIRSSFVVPTGNIDINPNFNTHTIHSIASNNASPVNFNPPLGITSGYSNVQSSSRATPPPTMTTTTFITSTVPASVIDILQVSNSNTSPEVVTTTLPTPQVNLAPNSDSSVEPLIPQTGALETSSVSSGISLSVRLGDAQLRLFSGLVVLLVMPVVLSTAVSSCF